MTTLYALPAPDAPPPPSREQVLAEAMQPLAAELALVDPSELIYLCRAEKHANITDLVESAAELIYRPETLRYGGAAEIDLQWDSPPQVVLDMEFEHGPVLVLFRLRIGAGAAAVDICHAVAAGPPEHPEAQARRLAACLDAAKLESAARA